MIEVWVFCGTRGQCLGCKATRYLNRWRFCQRCYDKAPCHTITPKPAKKRARIPPK